MVEFFEEPVMAAAGIAVLVFAALFLLKLYSKLMSRVG